MYVFEVSQVTALNMEGRIHYIAVFLSPSIPVSLHSLLTKKSVNWVLPVFWLAMASRQSGKFAECLSDDDIKYNPFPIDCKNTQITEYTFNTIWIILLFRSSMCRCDHSLPEHPLNPQPKCTF